MKDHKIMSSCAFLFWIFGMTLIVYYAGWGVAIGLFFVMWADNVNSVLRLENCGIEWWATDWLKGKHESN